MRESDGRTRIRYRRQGKRGRESIAVESNRTIRFALASLARASELFLIAAHTTDVHTRRSSIADARAMADLARRQIDELLEHRGGHP